MRVGIAAGLSVGLACGVGATDGGATGAPPPLPKRLVVIAGQSNALGLGVDSGLSDASYATSYPAVQYIEKSPGLSDPLIFTTDGPRDLSPRTVAVGGQAIGTFGPELSMGRALDDAGTAEWFIAKMAIDGSGLEDHWNNPLFPTTGGALLTQFSTFIAAQEVAFGADLAAIVWVQGEADANNTPDDANYKTNLASFFGSLRSTFGAVPVVINRLSSNYFGQSLNTTRSLQESWVAEDGNAAVVYGDDLPFRDTVHFTDDAYVTLGLRLADKVLDLVDGAAAPAHPTWKAGGAVIVATSAQSLTPVWPAHEADDIGLLILSGIGVNAYTLSTAAGFAAVPDSPQWAGVSTDARLQVWWCRATSSAMASPTIADAASDNSKIAAIMVIKGAVATGDPWDVTAGSATGTASTSVTFPGDTTTVANTLIVNILAHTTDLATAQVSGWTNADLTDLTEHFDFTSLSGLGAGLSIATGVKATAGAFAGTTATLATSVTQARLTIAIKP